MSRVLLVDDDAAALEIRKRIVERAGHVVALGADADAARRAFAEFQPEVVVLDLRLPDVADGLALIRDFHPTRIVVLCGLAADLDGRPERELIDALVEKPARPDTLLRLLTSVS
jgi:DNA-binding response OmpR family regulator